MRLPVGRVVRHRMIASPHVHARLDTIRSWLGSKRRGGWVLPLKLSLLVSLSVVLTFELKSLIRKWIVTGAAAVCLIMSHPKVLGPILYRIRAADKTERKQIFKFVVCPESQSIVSFSSSLHVECHPKQGLLYQHVANPGSVIRTLLW